MAPRKNKVSHSTESTKYRLSSAERQALRTAEIAGKQAELKREAAERRAQRAQGGGAERNSSAASIDGNPATPRSSDPR
jgi:hypothetical protein